MNKPAAALLIAAFASLSTGASAASLSLLGWDGSATDAYTTHTLNSSASKFDLDNDGAPYTSLTGNNGIDGQVVQVLMAGNKSASNGLYVDGPATVTYTYLGKEAGFTNRLKLSAGDTTIFQTSSTARGAVSGPYSILAAGLLPFKFTSEGDAKSVFNNGLAGTGMNIAYLILSATSALVFLDDFGAGPDSDFDDIGIRIDIAAVPIPAGVLLLGSGLALLGALGRRRKAAAA